MPHIRVVIALAIVFLAAHVHGQSPAYLVKDINQTLTGQSSTPTDFLQLGNLVVFKAVDRLGAGEVWRSDGSEAGTFRLGTGGRVCVVWNGKVWFSDRDDSLMSSDGTQVAQSSPPRWPEADVADAVRIRALFHRQP